MLAKLLQRFYRTYDALFARKAFFKWNRFLYNLSIRGLGIMTDASKAEHHFLKDYLLKGKKNKVVFDVGGNIGGYALDIKQIAPDAQVYSFEPNPKTFKIISEKAKQNNFQVFQYALGNMQGKVKFYDYEGTGEGGTEHASLYKEVIEGVHHKQSIEFEVDITTVDAFAKEHGISTIDLLKIDTEGNEMEVLLGATQMLRNGQIEVIQFEFNEMNVVSRTFLKDFMKFLPEYNFYRLLKDGYIALDKYFAGYHEIFAWQNIIAVKKTSSFKP